MEEYRLRTLLEKYKKQQLTLEEEKELDSWYEQFGYQAETLPSVPDKKLEGLLGYIEEQIQNKHSRLYLKKWRKIAWGIGSAAVIVIGCMIGNYFWNSSIVDEAQPWTETFQIRPGRIQAELILEDGVKVALERDAVVKNQHGQLIKKTASDVLDYSLVRDTCKQQVYNRIIVPEGGEYRLILADGTQVWLNSGSVLEYPVRFQGTVREVTLSGEAFFKVTKSHSPFLVKVADMSVKVLGTSFNVSAYQEDESILTTLVTGCVEVSSKRKKQKYKMTPGHILTFTKATQQVLIEECDPELYVSWINGIFKFRHMKLENIMQKVKRWYSCNVVYEQEELRDLYFSGAVEKDKPVDYMLDLIKKVTEIDYTIREDTIFLKHR